ncbi:hypothetical protein ACO0K0_08755 [Undibacterium sp. SXout11W]|uniref:hypothetical protein n=1 Tax=Undibacterium sp. SXout11W TaxID=3413050 RepID=UPI003BF30E02
MTTLFIVLLSVLGRAASAGQGRRDWHPENRWRRALMLCVVDAQNARPCRSILHKNNDELGFIAQK